jgi:hypothetical protein
MVKNVLETKSSLKSIEKMLDKNQILSTEKQSELKGGCSACEDNRRPPRVDSGTVLGGGHRGNWGNNW